MSDGKNGLQLRSLLKKSGELELSLVDVPTPEPADDEVVVRVEATPINPSDLGLLDRPGRHVDRKGFRHHGRSRDDRKDAGSRHADDGGAARSVASRRQRGCRRRGQDRIFGRRQGADGQDGLDDRWRDVHAVSHHQGAGRHGASRGCHASRRRVVVRQSADRARHDRNHAA